MKRSKPTCHDCGRSLDKAIELHNDDGEYLGTFCTECIDAVERRYELQEKTDE